MNDYDTKIPTFCCPLCAYTHEHLFGNEECVEIPNHLLSKHGLRWMGKLRKDKIVQESLNDVIIERAMNKIFS